MTAHRQHRGFTLIEPLVVIAIVVAQIFLIVPHLIWLLYASWSGILHEKSL